jgi:D-alanyl-D-alanine carboxypeptidase
MDQLIRKIDIQTKLMAKAAPTLQVSINVPSLKLDYHHSSSIINQKFHSASVGKLFTATLIFILLEQNLLKLDSKIKDFINDGILDKLFIFRKVDYQNDVTIKHLLNHTSGINDYFDGPTFDKTSFTAEILSNPTKLFTPLDLINYTKNHQKTVNKPGVKFFYSDTGYILLGLIIEKITKLSFSEALNKYIISPLKLEHTGLCFYHKHFDAKQLAPLHFNNKDISKFKSLSCDFSGGGLYTTTQDLTKFLKALMGHQLIKETSIAQIEAFDHSFNRGIFYGLGMMQLKFDKFFFLLKNLPKLQGHLGVTGVHAWYSKDFKETYVFNVGNNKEMIRSFQYLINLVQIIEKEKKQLVK